MLCGGRLALLSHPSFGDRSIDDLECTSRQLTVHDDLTRIAQESAVFSSLALQVTAFICNLDEATVNCGAADAASHTARLSSSSTHAATSLSRSSSGHSSELSSGTGGGASVNGTANGNAGARAAISAAASPSNFQRLRASPDRESGFGWRDSRAAFELALRRENRVERMVARSDPVAAEQRLMQRLLVARLEAVPFKGCTSGDALFEALALALWGTTLFATSLRTLAVSYAAAHPEEYRCFLGDDWQLYLSAMARPGTPGDELMLRAVSDHFGLPINIATSDAFMWFQRYSPVKTMSQREVTLAFLGPNTWMPVRRQSAITSLKLSLSGSSEWRLARDLRRKMSQQDGHPPATP
ncbi:hypothetical protein ACK3TF_002303 [Chlorella vulgaris]